jgi:uroporphyrinogen III methyltransferase / synthase
VGGQKLIIASRESALAVAQVYEALNIIQPVLPDGALIEIKSCTTPGDRDQITALADPSLAQDFFTRDLDLQIVNGEAHLAIHSAKDLPNPLPPHLVIAAMLPAKDIRDALVVRSGLTIETVRVIGSSSPKRNAELAALYPEWTIKPIRGTVHARLKQLDDGEFDAVIIAACALDRLRLTSRINRFMPWDPTPNQGRLALVVHEDNVDLRERLGRLDVRQHAGLVVLLGCPADFTLIPHRALQYLRHADVVVHDRLVPDEVLAIIKDKSVPVGKTGGAPSTPQSEVHRQILHAAESGKLVVRLHGGDPGIYGRLNEEMEFLSAWNMRVDIVPSVTAAQVAAAHAGAPLTHRGEGHRLTLISGNPPPGAPVPAIPGPDIGNLAVYMGVGSASRLPQRFAEAGWTDRAPIIVGERLGHTDERIRHITLSELNQIEIQSPAVFIVGAKHHRIQHRMLFTGTDPEHFLKYGPIIHWPMIELKANGLETRTEQLRQHLDRIKGIIFPSRFAVHCITEALMQIGDVRLLNGKRLLAVGPSTQEELHAAGLRADAAAPNLGGIESLVKELAPDERGTYLYPCSNESPKSERTSRMREFGIELVPVEFYRNQPTEKRPLPRLEFSRVLFTSSSTVQTYFDRYPEEAKANRTWIAVGPSTLKALQKRGLTAQLLAAV